MERIRKTVSKIDKYVCLISCIAIVSTMVLVSVHVIRRILFTMPIAGLTDYIGLMTVTVIALALPWVESEKGHIKVEFIKDYLPVKVKRVVFLIIDMLTNIVIIILMWRMAMYALNCYKVGNMTSVVYIPFWPFVVLTVIGLFLYFLTSLVNYISEIVGWRQDEVQA